MPVLPIPMIIALLLFVLLAHRLATRETHASLLALIAVCALQAGIIALVQYYGVAMLRPLQAMMATVIPPVAWFGFRQAASGRVAGAADIWHGSGLALAMLCLWLQPMLLDVLIPVVFASYGAAMLWVLARGEDSLPHSRLESGGAPLLAWRIVAASLVASAACDVVVAYQLATGANPLLLWAPSVVSSLSLLSLGALSLTHAMESQREREATGSSLTEVDEARDQAIIAKLDDYMKTHRPYLDPDLTLSRLARKLIVPAKQLSTAINRSKGENVSRFINRHRIEHACTEMAAGKSVTSAMLDAGFNTKSNFNREFLRVRNMSPSKWQDQSSEVL